MKNVFEHVLKIEKVYIENFRLFEQLEVELHPELTVFISENGAGKTTVLDAIAGHLHYLTDLIIRNAIGSRAPQRKTKNYFPNYIDDLNDATKASLLSMLFNAVYFDATSEDDIEKNNIKLQSAFEFEDGEDFSYNSSERLNNSIKLSDELNRSIGTLYEKKIDINLPILIYYPCSFANPKYEEKKIRPLNIFSAWDDALNDAAYDFGDFANWYKHLIVKSWSEIIREKQTGNNTLQDTVKDAILSMLNDEKDKFSDFTLDVESYPEQLVIKKGDKQLKYNQLSSGEKHLLVLTADIARRLYIANPDLPDPLKGQGIVLIDEIDLHLHPRWQRKVIPQLRKTFPNIQFVVTTHSPLVLNQLKSENVRILEGAKCQTVEHYMQGEYNLYGAKVEEVVKQLMGLETVYPSDVTKKLNKLAELINAEKLSDAKIKIKEIAHLIGSTHPELLEMQSLIDLKEVI